MDEYKSFFLKYQSRNLSENIKKSKSKKLSNAPEEIKSYFDSEEKESNSTSSSDDEDEDPYQTCEFGCTTHKSKHGIINTYNVKI